MNGNGDPVVLLSGVRTAIGRFGGALRDVDAHELGAACIRETLARAGVEPDEVDEVVMGQVGQVGPDAYNARRCALAAGIPASSTALNVNRLCSSGLQAIVSAAQELLTGQAAVVVAGGDESMSRQPFLDYNARDGWRLGPRRVLDGTLSLVTDPFEDYPMGMTAELVAERYAVSREQQDAFAGRSQARAVAAIEAGHFEREIVPVTPPRTEVPFLRDEHPRADTTVESLAALKPAFKRDGGTVTAGNSAGINDGAAALVLMRASEAERRGLTPRLVLRSVAVSGIEPEVMGYAPALAIPKALERAGLGVAEIDLVELNEAFAAQAVPVIRDAGLDPETVNVSGGAIALGHPVGATGAILTVKLMHALERLGLRRGLVTMCIGGGQGMAAVFERPA
ncbi:MAG: thiolase family protein [Thermoleophilia bacterium]|nr:thiolase family protein [Thermoleophilia bacterium]